MATNLRLPLTLSGGQVEQLQTGDFLNLVLPASLSDEEYAGLIENGTAGENLAFGEAIYFDVTTSKWKKTKADAEATSKGKIGMCVLAANADAATKVLLWGKIRADAQFPTLTIGAPVFLSAATAGVITSTVPSGTTNFVVRIIGYGNTGDEMFFCPSPAYVVLA